MTSPAIENAIGFLANHMRLYGEAQLRFGSLFKVDREEAIDNVDRAFEANLEAFHTLHDVSRDAFRYFEFADTALLIAMRNAVHHRSHPLFRSLDAATWLDGDPAKRRGAAFLLARHRIVGDPPVLMRHHFKLADFRARLDPGGKSPFRDTILGDARARERFLMISETLGFEKIQQKGKSERYPADQVYLDVVPIFISAVSRVFKALHASGMRFKGFDAETYLVPLTTEVEVDLGSIEYKMARLL